MNINIKELRRVAVDCSWPTSPVPISDIIDRLEAAEKERDKLKELNIALCANSNSQVIHNARLAEENYALRAKLEAMEKQVPVKYERRIKRRSEHTWGHWRECYKVDYVKAKAVGGHYPKFSDDLFDYEMRPLYTLPGAQPAPSVPREAIEKMLTQLMDTAVSNGANSVSMPDEYVEVAAWLCGIPAQPAPSVPDGWQLVPSAESRHPGIYKMLGALHAAENTPGMSEWESYQAMLAAAPEAKP